MLVDPNLVLDSEPSVGHEDPGSRSDIMLVDPNPVLDSVPDLRFAMM
jgi:hypothetical protein